jgi:hypothetical protein
VQAEEMRLDGNAAAGMLRDIFVRDMTVAEATCIGCGFVVLMGGLLEYGHAMGIVLRCPACEHVMLRLVRTPGSLRLDVSGTAMLCIAEGVRASG